MLGAFGDRTAPAPARSSPPPGRRGCSGLHRPPRPGQPSTAQLPADLPLRTAPSRRPSQLRPPGRGDRPRRRNPPDHLGDQAVPGMRRSHASSRHPRPPSLALFSGLPPEGLPQAKPARPLAQGPLQTLRTEDAGSPQPTPPPLLLRLPTSGLSPAETRTLDSPRLGRTPPVPRLRRPHLLDDLDDVFQSMPSADASAPHRTAPPRHASVTAAAPAPGGSGFLHGLSHSPPARPGPTAPTNLLGPLSAEDVPASNSLSRGDHPKGPPQSSPGSAASSDVTGVSPR